MGNRESQCKTLSGDDFTKCIFDNRSREQAVQHHSRGQEVSKDVLGSYYDFIKDCNNRPYDPDMPLFCITPGDRHIQDSENGFIDVRSPEQWMKGEQEILPLTMLVKFGPDAHLGQGGPRIMPDVYSAFNLSNKTRERIGEIDLRSQLASKGDFNKHMINYYLAAKMRIHGICPDLFDKVWPEFYHFYNTANGKQLVDAWIEKNPQAPASCTAALKQNFTDESQKLFGLLNEPDYFSGLWPGLRSDNFQWSLVSGIEQYAVWPFTDPAQASFRYMRKTLDQSKMNGHFYGNPLWSKTDRNQALSRALGKDIVSGQDFYIAWAQSFVNKGVLTAGQTALDYFDPEKTAGMENTVAADDPNFGGKLPYAPAYLVGNEPWHNTTNDPNSYGYDNPCSKAGGLEMILPFVAGALAGGVCAVLIPGSNAKLIGVATMAPAAYLLVKGVYGWQATLQLFGAAPPSDVKNTAAKLVSIGGPLTIGEMLVESGFLPPAISSASYGHVGVLAVSAGLGAFLVYPFIAPIFNYGGSAFTALSAPIAAIEYGINMLFSGCLAHQNVDGSVCKCENANSKAKLIKAITEEMLGTTGAQRSLRKQCLRAAMTNGAWGKHPVEIGGCNNNGIALEAAACYPAGSWVYEKYGRGSPNSQQMFNEIQHCMDAENLSMLPPRPEDQGCVDAYGIYARNDGSGKCKDFRAPLGLQNVGQYVFDVPKSNECAIL